MGAVVLTNKNFTENIKSGVTLVDFYANWCGPCLYLLPRIEELANDLEGKATVAKVDIDENSDLATRFGVQSIPTLLLFKDGKLIESMVGIKEKRMLKDKIMSLV